MNGTILSTRDGAVATVVLSNPQRRNAMNLAMWHEISETLGALIADESVRCIVLRGDGSMAFSAGADIDEFSTVRSNAQQARAYGAVVERAMSALQSCPKPVVALIEGACVGGGMEVAALCDIRICGASSTFGVPATRLGLTLSYAELSGLLSLVGRAVTLELLLDGAILDAKAALQKGLVTQVVEDGSVERDAYALASRLARRAPLVAAWHKKFIHRLLRSPALSEEELREGWACFDTEDYQIGYRSFLEKNQPEFKGR